MDMGNSRCKAVLAKADQELNKHWLERFTWDNQQFDKEHWLGKLQSLKLQALELQATIQKIYISSVANEQTKLLISSWCQSIFELKPVFADSQASYSSGVDSAAQPAVNRRQLVNSYDKPTALGVDRWLAMVGAIERSDGAFAVLDAGTAITLDLVDNKGQHLGGHIVPGARLMQKALFGDTGKIAYGASLDASDPTQEQWLGNNSLQAVELGTYQAALGYLKSCIERLQSHYGIAEIFVCGGDGALMMEQILLPANFNWLHCPDLVLEGLFYQQVSSQND